MSIPVFIKVVNICWCLFEWERSASKRIEKTLFSAFVSETYWLERKQVECYNDFNVKQNNNSYNTYLSKPKK